MRTGAAEMSGRTVAGRERKEGFRTGWQFHVLRCVRESCSRMPILV